MKKAGIILSLTAAIVLMTSMFGTASALTLDKTYPEDGYQNAAVDNFGMKLYFDQDLINKDNEAANKECIKITDADGKEVPSLVVYSEKEEGLVMVLADVSDSDVTINQASEYKISISGDFAAANGETLGEDKVITVKTLDQTKASKVNMILMIVMCVGMVFFSNTASKKQKEDEERAKREKEKVNPYKVSKETGKSVEEVVAEDVKRKEKQAAANAKREKKEREQEEYLAESELKRVRDDVHHVKRRARGVKASESPYVAKHEKELAAKRAAAKAKGTTHPKKAGGKKRGAKRSK